MPTPLEVDRAVYESIVEYVRRAKTLRQIHSNKGATTAHWARVYLGVTVGLGTLVSVIGFMGPEAMEKAIGGALSTPDTSTIYAVSVLMIVILSIFGLIYRFDERSTRHYRSIEILTEFIRDSEDRALLSQRGIVLLTVDDLSEARTRYKGILASLPANTDKEYLKAKNSAASKKAAATEAERSSTLDIAKQWTADAEVDLLERDLASQLAVLMLGDSRRLSVLRTVAATLGGQAWITGGFIREAVWDALHNYQIPTPSDDIDVIYFDQQDTAEASEKMMRRRLLELSPNVNWSVKNEARMHVVAMDAPYHSMRDAVARFPETATAIAVQLDDGRLRIMAPHGLRDLFSLTLRPTAPESTPAFDRRISSKQWADRWPKLVIAPPSLGRGGEPTEAIHTGHPLEGERAGHA